MRLHIVHRTVYRYHVAPRRIVQTLHLTPPADDHQAVPAWSLRTTTAAQWQRDPWGNTVHLVAADDPGRRLECVAEGIVETRDVAVLTQHQALPAPWWLRETALCTASTALRTWADRHRLAAPVAPDAGWALALADAVADTVAYVAGATHVGTTAAQAFGLGRGVCQDQAHVYLAACRSLGVPARYVSGYFHGLHGRQGGSAGDGAAHRSAVASHAWAEVCLDAGASRWLGVDVTHRCLVDERHVRLAVGPDYAACAPVRGVISGGAGEHMVVEVAIEAAAGRS